MINVELKDHRYRRTPCWDFARETSAVGFNLQLGVSSNLCQLCNNWSGPVFGIVSKANQQDINNFEEVELPGLCSTQHELGLSCHPQKVNPLKTAFGESAPLITGSFPANPHL